MRRLHRQHPPQQKSSTEFTGSNRSALTATRAAHPALYLQRAIGNQAVQRVRQHLGNVTVQADVDAGVPPAKAPDKSPSKDPKAPAAPTCTYKITYANQKNLGCDPKEPRGASIQYDITKVKATGKGCPATLDGLKLTEKVTSDQGCHPQQPTTGPGCTIHADKKKPLEGRFEKCTDTYSVCGDKQAFLFKGCVQVLTQEIFIDGVLADTRKIKFEIFKTGSKPSGKATRT